MQKRFNRTHINERFQERFGRSFTKQDRQAIIDLVAQGKAKISPHRKNKDIYFIYCVYESRRSTFIVSSTMNFITCYPNRR